MAELAIIPSMGGVMTEIGPFLERAPAWPEQKKLRFASEWRQKEAAGAKMLDFGKFKEEGGKWKLPVRISAAFRDHCAAYGVQLN